MTRIAIIGGGLSGLTAAYELEEARRNGAPLDWRLYEASDRLGGIVETTRLRTPEGTYILEGGPDGWVTEKPWARELAIELGLRDELIFSNDAGRRTYIYLDGQLQAIPEGMRLMVPEDLQALRGSSLFSAAAQEAYAGELRRAEELKAESPLLDPGLDESVASFVLRHFGPEVLEKLAAPLLSGVFGGDVHRLSVRAVMPQFVRMEREYGSLVLALGRAKAERDGRPMLPIFTSLRGGMASLIEALVAKLPSDRIALGAPVSELTSRPPDRALGGESAEMIAGWTFLSRHTRSAERPQHADHVLLATSLDTMRALLGGADQRAHQRIAQRMLATDASSAVLANLVWPARPGRAFPVPSGFGFLAPQQARAPGSDAAKPQLLACTFVNQKFPHRGPAGAHILRAFFGSAAAEHFAGEGNAAVVHEARVQLAQVLGPLPEPEHTEVRHWPRSLPQYEIGHLARMAELEREISARPGLHLLGNALHGVGVPDLIREARHTVRRLAGRLQVVPDGAVSLP